MEESHERFDHRGADPSDHFIHTTLQAGAYRAEHVRLWEAQRTTLKPQD